MIDRDMASKEEERAREGPGMPAVVGYLFVRGLGEPMSGLGKFT